MTRTNLAKLMISCYTFNTKEEFIRLINYLTICMYHTDNNEMASDIQDVIWYISDKMLSR